ncbi:taurine ABC transporter ATP-binding subunit [Variovorax sp. J22G47]|nr:taurine ABC transporter ATP-binding subunit [Variovorax sp. J22G47]MDM0059093.1 taurine ABC transporter ATP-binding subunit [Variovorax sp. J22G47]
MLKLARVSAQYPGTPAPVLEDIGLEIGPRQLLVALGPSGSGKTTLLNLIAGFVAPSGGHITLDGREVRGAGADRGVVFQEHALLPWLDVLGNTAFGLQLRGTARPEREARAREQLALVGLEGFEARQIWQLSGGQKQRVGIARALAADPEMLLLDEPFGALDAFTREQVQQLLLKVWRQAAKPMFLITHDIEEAVFLATDLILLGAHPGRITERLELDFGRRHAEGGESARAIKSDPRFIATREHVLSRVFAGQTATSTA